MFLNNMYGLFAIVAGATLAFNGKVKKGISIAVFLALLFFASLTTEPRLSDLIVSSVWYPFVGAYVGASIMRLFGKEEEKEEGTE
ncbi:MAG: hypothetical protein OEX81_00410 [Candidatus Pacebacteria bacterium]|nr:hypothetical protein [Candidatus Paceibacterota bacterium]